MNKILLAMLTAVALMATNFASGSPIKDDEIVILFPTNAFLDSGGQVWKIPVHGWIFEEEDDSFWRQVVIDSLPDILEVEPDEKTRPIYEERARMFLVDNERGKKIEVELAGKRSTMASSEANGHFQGIFYVDRNRIRNQSESGWVTFQAITGKDDPRVFTGKAQLIGTKGVSVISDIDDTIKISNVKDKEALLKNTFLKQFTPVPGMPELYSAWQQQGAVFHYLSASPWQLFPPLSEFITASGFPEGSFNLKNIRLKDETFFNLFSSQEEYKKPIVENLLKKYPERQFILVGDGGEEDPVIFAGVAVSNPEQILHIFIRDLEPGAAKSEHYLSIFDGIPDEKWTIFTDGNDLSSFSIPENAKKM